MSLPLESPIQGEEYRRVLGEMAREHVDGVIISDQAEHITCRQPIVDLVRAAKLPTVFPYREFFEIGALMAPSGTTFARGCSQRSPVGADAQACPIPRPCRPIAFLVLGFSFARPTDGTQRPSPRIPRRSAQQSPRNASLYKMIEEYHKRLKFGP